MIIKSTRPATREELIQIINNLEKQLNKEKEKNKELDYKNAHEYRKACKERDSYWKDKIKDNVDYIRFMVDDDNKPYEIVKEVNLYLDLFLQELLEERD